VYQYSATHETNSAVVNHTLYCAYHKTVLVVISCKLAFQLMQVYADYFLIWTKLTDQGLRNS